ncbi:ATP-binding protein [Agaribacterium sp. ZY112]|uniref:PAS domain-containing sensor histidine kinase n=1 Tax=Agaribacterium sp. ZY112 TaxID=3233574 RepID=UPI003526B1E4
MSGDSTSKSTKAELERRIELLECELARNRNFFRTALDHLPVRVFWKDTQSLYLGANRLFVEDAGLSSLEQLVGCSDYDLPWDNSTAELYRKDDKYVMSTELERVNYEEPQERDGKTVNWLRTTKVPLRNDHNEVIGVLGTYEDISEFKAQQLALAESEERYKLALAGVSDGIFDWNIDQQRLFLSDTAKRVLELAPDYEGRSFEPIVSCIQATHQTSFYRQLVAHLKGESPIFEVELPMTFTSGRRWILVRGLAKPDKQGRCQRMCGSVSDISSRREAQEEIHRLNSSLELKVSQRTSELESTNEKLLDALAVLRAAQDELIQNENLASLGALVSSVAHEANTPLGISLTASSHLVELLSDIEHKFESGSLKKSDFLNFFANTKECSDLVQNNLKRASDLIGSFKKIAVDKSSEELRSIGLGDYIKEIVLSLSPRLRKAKVNPVVSVDGEVTLTTYPGSIAQVFTNLIMNSIHHAFVDIDKPEIHINCKREKDDLVLTYWDNGVGISDEIKGQIFAPFFTTKRESGGSGLGLNIVHNIVCNKLKGRVVCESDLGKGACFYISLPCD